MPEEESFASFFGANVRRYREIRGLTQHELSARAGVHRSEVGMVERGQRVPRVDTAFRLACALAAPFDHLFGGIEWVERSSVPGEFFFVTPKVRRERHKDVMRRAAALRARQTEVVDAAALVREGREELERRGCPEDDH